jgi:hypothetical protein
LATHLEAIEKTLAEERSVRQTADQDLRTAQDFATALNRELSSKVSALEEPTEWEKAAQDALWALADEKQVPEQELSSTQNMFTERDTSSSKLMASAVAQTAGLLKSHVPYLEPELHHEDYRCETNAKQDALIDGAFDAAQHFVSEYDFSVINDQGSTGV